MPVGQPSFVQKWDGSCSGASTAALSGSATGSGHTLLVGVVQNQADDFGMAGVTDSQGVDGFGNPKNTWGQLGSPQSSNGVTITWFVCKNALPITALALGVANGGAATFMAFMAEYAGANGLTVPQLQTIPAAQNALASLKLSQCAAAFSGSPAAIMLGVFTMVGDTFGSAMSGTQRDSASLLSPVGLPMVFQLLENGTVDDDNVLINGSSFNPIAQSFNGDLTLQAQSSDQFATQANLAQCTMQCCYLLLCGGLVLNTQPGFFDQQDSSLAAGTFSLGFELAKISSNAALGMTRMEVFQGLYKSGDSVAPPISPVDGYQYQSNELAYLWAIYSTANPNTGWITGPMSLWYCGWKVDQETGLVTCDEWYRNTADSGSSQDGVLQVFTVGMRQKASLMLSTPPVWTDLSPFEIGQDAPQAEGLMQALNGNSKFAVVGQECLYCGEFYNGQTVPAPTSPADGYAYSLAAGEVKFVWCWRWTTTQAAYTVPAWLPEMNLCTMKASVSSSSGAVTCAVGWSENDGNNYQVDPTTGRVAVFAFCTRNPSRTTALANGFAEIDLSLMYPGLPVPASLVAQIAENITEAANSPEFFGPTLYTPGETVPLPVSPIDGYEYARGELTYLWDWSYMIPVSIALGQSFSSHLRAPLFSAQIDAGTGLVSTDCWRLPPGGPYVEDATDAGQIWVLTMAFRASQAAPLSEPPFNQPPPGYGSYVEPS